MRSRGGEITREPNWQIVDDLIKVARDASDRGHILESAIISFQRLEILLRIGVAYWAEKKKLSDFAMEKIEEEKDFYRLVLYLDFVKPDNRLSKELLKLNNKRNSIIHRLFYDFESFDSVKKELQDFYLKSLVLNNKLGKILDRSNITYISSVKK